MDACPGTVEHLMSVLMLAARTGDASVPAPAMSRAVSSPEYR